MEQAEHKIISQVCAAKTDSQAADALVREYMGFIRSETVKFTHALPENGHEDELSIAMLAFYEAVLGYERARGAFLPYAARAIRNRLIDYYRQERRRSGELSLQAPLESGEEGALMDHLAEERDLLEERALREASREEIQEFGAQLAGLGLSFSDVADNCPRQARTLAACRRVLEYARSQPALLEELVRTGRLPISELARGSGTDRKTLERHRRYLVAVLLAFTNGYEIIRGHLCQIGPGNGGGRA